MKDVMKFKKYVKISLFIFVALFILLICYLAYSVTTYGEKWFATPYNPRLQSAAGAVRAGTITDRDGVKLAWTEEGERKYSETKSVRLALAHTVGDNKGKSMGAETLYAKYLYGFEKSILDRLGDAVQGTDKQGSDIALTVDSELSEYIYEQMDGRRGSVVVMNYKTGEILSMVNIPTFDPANLGNDEDLEDSSLVNRALMGAYPPGSTMKVMTAAAALESGTEFTYTCTGETIIEGQKITCSDGAHGEMNLESAVAKSCNTYFAQLATKLGKQKLTAMAEKFAYNYDFNFSDIPLRTGNFEVSDNQGDLAWAGIGQYNDLVTPMQNAMIAGAIANGGIMMEPQLLMSIGSSNEIDMSEPTQFRRIMDTATANTLKQYMRGVVTGGTGTRAAVDGLEICGKTGTAEYMEDGEKKSHAWFIGFINSSDTPYCISVILEGAGSGGRNAAPLAGNILEQAAKG